MKENVGTADRVARSVIGPSLIALGYRRLGGNRGRPVGLAAMIGGALLVESAITRVCPLNRLLGIDTRRPRQKVRDEPPRLSEGRGAAPHLLPAGVA